MVIGQPLRRFEDDRLIRGLGQYVEDIKLPRMAYAVFVRSQVANGRIKRINVEEAKKVEGVIAIITGQDIKDRVGKNFTAWIVPNSNKSVRMCLRGICSQLIKSGM